MSRGRVEELHLDDPTYSTHPSPCAECERRFSYIYYSNGAPKDACNVLCYYLLYGAGPAYLEEIIIYCQGDVDRPRDLRPVYNFGALISASTWLRRAGTIALATNLRGRGGQDIFFIPDHETRLRPWPADTPPVLIPPDPPRPPRAPRARSVAKQLEED